ncbi:MAG: menaquinone biosynthesis protein [Acidobacteria bacterium]|nr:menaquinone biosynthesis protein [Acidobacteriota bacterium]
MSFLNALPYVEGFRKLPEAERPRVLLDPPFRCAERLARGEVTAALVPSIEWARLPGSRRVHDFGIASRAEVRSVLLLSKRPLDRLADVAVDANSRTSVALLRLLLARVHGVRPACHPMEANPDVMLGRCDAALLIGDAALAARVPRVEVHDLAAMWNAFTGMPFVFAVWAANDEVGARRAEPVLEAGLAAGLAGLEESAARAAFRHALSAVEILSYLTRNIHYRLGPDEAKSLDAFLGMCRDEGWIGAHWAAI